MKQWDITIYIYRILQIRSLQLIIYEKIFKLNNTTNLNKSANIHQINLHRKPNNSNTHTDTK